MLLDFYAFTIAIIALVLSFFWNHCCTTVLSWFASVGIFLYNAATGRALGVRKDAGTAVKDSTESSSHTIDENETDLKGLNLKHENTVIHVEHPNAVAERTCSQTTPTSPTSEFERSVFVIPFTDSIEISCLCVPYRTIVIVFPRQRYNLKCTEQLSNAKNR
ncbi:hypothetical protein Tsp_02593 [Trichinella spiralis]|uniref:hypothetical protein n=1 Tax=Trichinella spiralis TaxID=6334 RepID=UPI0001EFB9B2|nr:hypothetical protein Tsp_02593 [Trichinella spiralis]